MWPQMQKTGKSSDNLGMTLERVWGTFRFNVYFFMGVIGHVLAALLIYIITGQVYILTTDCSKGRSLSG